MRAEQESLLGPLPRLVKIQRGDVYRLDEASPVAASVHHRVAPQTSREAGPSDSPEDLQDCMWLMPGPPLQKLQAGPGTETNWHPEVTRGQAEPPRQTGSSLRQRGKQPGGEFTAADGDGSDSSFYRSSQTRRR